MATTHLTEFLAAPAIHISVASPAQLAPSASDLARLRFLITVIVVLFAIMCAGAYLLGLRDAADSRSLRACMLSPELGFRIVPNNAGSEDQQLWTWRFSQSPLEDVVDAVGGSFVELAGLMGMPVVRLAAALPESWLHTSVQAATGRRDGLSATSFKEQHVQHGVLQGAMRSSLVAAHPGAAAAPVEHAPAPTHERRASLVKAAAAVEGMPMSRGGHVKMHATAPATRAHKNTAFGDELVAAAPPMARAQPQPQDVDGWAALPHDTAISVPQSGADEMVSADVQQSMQPASWQQDVDGWDTPPHHNGGSAIDSSINEVDAPDVQEMVSTALAHAVLLGYCIASAEEVAEQQVAYLERLAAAGVDTDGRRFLHLFTVFKELIIPGVLGSAQSWLRNARLARVVLLSNPSGFWDADSGIALSLLAQSHRVEPSKKQGMRLLLSYLQSVVTAAVSVVIGGVSASSSASAANSVFQSRTRAHSKRISGGATVETVAPGIDCPLLFTSAAIAETLPSELADAFVESSGTALRAWSTALVAELLLTLDLGGWRVCATPCVDDDVPTTLVDAALRWLSVTLDTDAPPSSPPPSPPTPKLLTAVRAAARDQVLLWAALHDETITSSRNAHVPSPLHKHVLEQRACGAIFTAGLTKHATMRLFTADAVFGGRRHQQFFVLVTLLIVALSASIWLYYSRALECCLRVRRELGCSEDPFSPCRGYARSCAELESIFYRFAHAAVFDPTSEVIEQPTAGLFCEAFPDPKYPLHTFVAGLISFACCMPAAWVLQSCFSLSMSTDEAQLHGRTRLMKWGLFQRLLLGAAPWRYRPGRAHRMRTRMASSWCTTTPDQLVVRACDALGALSRRAGVKPRLSIDAACSKIDTPLSPLEKRLEEEEEEVNVLTRDERLCDAAACHDRVTENFKRAGFVLVAAAWGICVWMILVYGSLIYRLLGPEAEETFTRSWGIGVGLDQLKEAKGVLIVSAQTVAALLVFEALYVSPNMAWLESMSDEASVGATLLRAGAGSFLARMRAYARFNKAVV
jgi:hypothetical protein